MDVDKAIADFAAPGVSELPREAMRWTLDHWEEAAPRLLGLLADYAEGRDRSTPTAKILFLVVHLAAEMRETRAFGPLCRLAPDDDAMVFLFGDSINLTLDNILTSTFDGDLAALKRVIESEEVPADVGSAAFRALAYLTASGRLSRDETEAYLRWLYDNLQPQEENLIWVGWAEAIALLGLDSLSDLVALAIDRGLVDMAFMELEDFQRELRRTLDSADPMTPFDEEQIGPIEDAIEELSRWRDMLVEAEVDFVGFDDLDEDEILDEIADIDAVLGDGPTIRPDALSYEPAVNPYRGVGRNDPCPCGSGKKFKKCCLPNRPA